MLHLKLRDGQRSQDLRLQSLSHEDGGWFGLKLVADLQPVRASEQENARTDANAGSRRGTSEVAQHCLSATLCWPTNRPCGLTPTSLRVRVS
jgi:hypothetical protein